MATLEKIRSKSVLLLIIIALALLAFILTDFFNSSRTIFGTGTTVAKVDGEKISINDLSAYTAEHQQQNPNMDGATMQAYALQQLATERLLAKEYDRLGLTVTDDELTQWMLGSGSQVMMQKNAQLFQQLGMDAKSLYDMVVNPTKFNLSPEQANALKEQWNRLEKQESDFLLQTKFGVMMGAFTANNLDLKRMYNDSRTLTTFEYTRYPYAKEDDKNYKVSDQEIENYWREHKEEYKLPYHQKGRSVGVISVSVSPSASDRQKANELMAKANEALKTQEGTAGVDAMSELVVSTAWVTSNSAKGNRVASEMRNALQMLSSDTAGIGSVVQLPQSSPNVYTLAKLLETKQEVDSISITSAMVPAAIATTQWIDSINAANISLAALKAVKDVEADSMAASMIELAGQPLYDPISKMETGKFQVMNLPGQQVPEGYTLIARVDRRSAPVTAYNIATVTYTLEPSNATLSKAQADLARYINQNNTAEAFMKNAQKSGYDVQNLILTPGTPSLGQLRDTKQGVAWAFKNKKGQVSPLFNDETETQFYAVAIEDVFGDEYIPASNSMVRERITNVLRNQKKGAALAKRFKGKANNVQGYAEAFGGTSVQTGRAAMMVPVQNPMNGNVENAVTMAAIKGKQGTVAGPIAGLTDLWVIQITGTEQNPTPYNAEQMKSIYQQSIVGPLLANPFNLLIGNKEFKDNSLEFTKAE